VLGAAIQFVIPTFVNAKEGRVYFQGAAAGVISAFDLETLAVVDTIGDIEDYDVVKEIGAGEAKAVVTVGLGEMGSFCYSQNASTYFLYRNL